ncbi:tRNA (guanosine-2'-O-)-methyltransferase [Gelidibacter sediminis]|uniref:tRNA (guanosine(18)-2'-O)-methyltransferase n=1 Tax=Gelidibacter sediminis TaxID=1608710 RepID=A0A4R7PXQ6_9FLAO|nr:RNA methyltransferase [Gelidibacter sediminis]TDU39735.1 tRNA (guanosine-2'-O-)-methyltransferase [Gelidibacter sediminis]
MIDLQLLQHLETYLTPERKLRFDTVLPNRTKHFTVATEDVYQLHNTSAVIRSCDVFGIQEVHIVEERNSKRIDREIAMGSQKWVDLQRYHSVSDCIQSLKQNGYQIVATTPHENDHVLSDFDIAKKSCFFFGRETEGLSSEVLEAADSFLKIPMVGFTESLNISVSAAIILQDVTNKLRQSDINWQLSEHDQLEKRLDWISKTLKSYDKIVERYYEAARR